MPEYVVLAGGTIKNTPEEACILKYMKRFLSPVSIHEYKTEKELNSLFLKHKSKISYWMMLDEKGKNYTSIEFANFIQKQIETHQKIGFIIGIDSGISQRIKSECQSAISFGQLTWPHLFARVMLIEQLYRTQQILNNHPYHKI